MKNLYLHIAMTASLIIISACAKSERTFSVLAETETFKQDTQFIQPKIDLLWVIDNSGSMATSQQNLKDNFPVFIQKFTDPQYDYDFHISVTSTEAYLSLPAFGGSSNFARFKDGVSTHSGIFVIDRLTSNLISVFQNNVILGTGGDGDERAFQSFKTSLTHTVNDPYNFRRSDAFLAVVIVSDENDFSHDGTGALTNPNSTSLHSIQSYVDFLNTYTASTSESKWYSVSTVAILDNACLTALGSGRRIGTRYMALADATGGEKISLCSDFGETLPLITENVLSLSSAFKLNRLPIVSSIRVAVNGVNVPNDNVNGWSYRESDNSILFHGTAIPPKDSTISVDFDPVDLGS